MLQSYIFSHYRPSLLSMLYNTCYRTQRTKNMFTRLLSDYFPLHRKIFLYFRITQQVI